MDPVTGIVAAKAIQGVTDVISDTVDNLSSTEDSSFESILRGYLSPDQANMINEEELFAALIAERLGATKSTEVQEKFLESFNNNKEAMTRGDGYCPVEDAANEALDGLVESGDLTAEEAEAIYSQAFEAAQLDDDPTHLYDSRGSGSDPTIAVMEMEAALAMAKSKISPSEAVDEASVAEDPAATDNTAENSSDITPEGTSVDGLAEGFLFKPESESSNNLVILLPAQLADQVESVVLKDEEGNEIEQGRSSGYANADKYGEREHFRFNKPGREYPEDLVVEVKLADGSVQRYHIPDPEQRYD